jgi:RNA recognition motif-containing protein
MEQDCGQEIKTTQRDQYPDFPWSHPVLSKHIVFVGLLPNTATRQKLEKVFSRFGRVVWLALFQQPNDFAYAHLLFDQSQAIDKVFEQGSHRIDGKNIRVRMWKSPEDGSHSESLLNQRKVFVKNISPRTSNKRLIEYFQQFGAVVHLDRGPRSRVACAAIAYIVFEKREQASQCLQASHGSIDGFKIKCKPFVKATLEPDRSHQKSDPEATYNQSQPSVEDYPTLIRLLEQKEKFKKEQSLQSYEKTKEKPQPTEVSSSAVSEPKPTATFKGQHLESQTLPTASQSNSKMHRQAARDSKGTADLPNGKEYESHNLSTSSSTSDQPILDLQEAKISCMSWRPIHVYFFVVDGYI